MGQHPMVGGLAVAALMMVPASWASASASIERPGVSAAGADGDQFAGPYPDEVVGFVSVDAAHEMLYEAYQELLRPEQYSIPGTEIDVVAAATAMRQARTAQPLQPMPMVVLEHSRDRARFPNPFGL